MREWIPFKSEPDKGDVNLLTWVKFVEEVKGNELFYVLIGKELIGGVPILKFLKSLRDFQTFCLTSYPLGCHQCGIFNIVLI